MTNPSRTLAQGSKLWTVSVTALLIAAALAGCQTEDPSGSDAECLLSGVYGVNPTTGACEIVSGCVMSTPSGLAYPAGWTSCDTTPQAHCEGLNEPTCGTVAGCEPHYTRTAGGVTLETDSTEPSDGANDAAMPYPDPMPTPAPGGEGYLYAGCYTHVDVCAGLDEQTCSYTSGCAPQYESVPCECGSRMAPPVDGDIVDGAAPMPPEDCACIALAQYAGCAEADIPQPSDCYSAGDTNSCLSQPGCRWVGEASSGSSGSGTGADICFCENPDDANCFCGGVPMPPERVGYCEPDYPVDPCMGWGDVRSCVGTMGCEWVETSGAPIACDCEPGTDCVCADFVPQPGGYCQQSTQPDSCYNTYDEYSCISTRGCEWVGMGSGGEAPPVDGDCACFEGDPNCGCGGAMPAPSGYCQPYSPPTGCWSNYDLYTCSSDAACVWMGSDGTGGEDIMPCDCVPDDANCACARPAPMPEGYCADRDVEPPVGCAQYGDERSCAGDPTCGWKPADGFAPPPACDCAADDPACVCDPMPEPWGECYDLPPQGCDVYGDEFSCISDAACAWSGDGSGAPVPNPDFCDPSIPGCGGVMDPCWGAWQDENGTCRGAADEMLADECCVGTEPPPPPPFGHCYAVAQDPCEGLPDAFSCESKEGCFWTEDNGNRPIAPPCTDPADPSCGGISKCEGAQLDAAGQCVLPTGEITSQDCCGAVVVGGWCSSGR